MASPLETRMKNIQKNLKVGQTGIFDIATCKAFEAIRSLSVSGEDIAEHRKAIQRSLGFTGKDVDGLFGVGTISRIEIIFDTTLPTMPASTSMTVSTKGLDIIIESEVSSKSAYDKKYKFSIWPGGKSGITIGIGYDLGYYSKNTITQDWQHLISASNLNKLLSVMGLTGAKAANALSASIRSIVIPWEAALEVFYTRSLPQFAKKTVAIYPEVAVLPPDAQAALVSLIYNRGNSLVDEKKDTEKRRQEMRNMVPLIKNNDLKAIAAEFRKMKRLWDPKKQGGLISRREREAVLIENATWVMAPNEYIFI